MIHEFRINVEAFGDYTEDELKEYLLFSMGVGSLEPSNPFIDDISGVDVSYVEFN